MSESDSFISEVTEEVRRDKLYRNFRRYRWAVVAVVVALVGGAAWHEFSAYRAETAAKARGDALRTAMATTDPAARALALDGIEAGPAEAVRRLAHAAAALEAGDHDKAGAILAEAAGDGATPEPYRSLAMLQRVMALGPRLEPGERLAALDGLAAPGAPFRPLALEQLALMKIDQGDGAGAAVDLQAILALPEATPGLRERAGQLLQAVGGDEAAAATDPDPLGAAPAAPAPAPVSGG